MANPPFDTQAANRHFAIELNNRAWDLVEATSRTAEETAEMIDAAHAACWHWGRVGQPVNHLRALVLLATAYAKAGLSECAVPYAEQALALGERISADATPFDRATIAGAAALAYRLADDREQAQRRESEFQLAVDQAPDDDRALLARLYAS